MQDVEFTIQRGKVWMLQTRNAKRTGFAAVRIAVDMVNEGLIAKEDALQRQAHSGRRSEPALAADLRSRVEEEPPWPPADCWPRASTPGPAPPRARSASTPRTPSRNGSRTTRCKLILVRRETSPEDLRGMKIAQGILTAFGGASSHAALVSRQMGKACIVGCGDLNIDYAAGTVTVKGKVLKAGDPISIDGFTGEVFEGAVETRPSEILQVLITKTLKPEQAETYQALRATDELGRRASHAARCGPMPTSPKQALEAIAFGAEGIGLCRTEHMFFDHIDDFREMILADDAGGPRKGAGQAAAAPAQGLRRHLPGDAGPAGDDPPARSAAARVPAAHGRRASRSWPRRSASTAEVIARRVQELHEFNPMLGHRGCRLGIVYPEITRMQARAIFEAACDVKKAGIEVLPEVMIPLAGFATEFRDQEKIVRETAEKVFAEKGIAGRIPGRHDDRVAAGRDLRRSDRQACRVLQLRHQRPDADHAGHEPRRLRQLHQPLPRERHHPQRSVPDDRSRRRRRIDEDRRGRRAARRGPNLKIGICGEHGGDPASVMFCHEIGLNYVSCSPFRVPIARLAAAQAAVAGRQSRREREKEIGWRSTGFGAHPAIFVVVRGAAQFERGARRHAAFLHEAAGALRKERMEIGGRTGRKFLLELLEHVDPSQAAAIDQPIGRLQFGDLLLAISVAAQADQVQPDDQPARAVDHHIRRHVLHDAGMTADHRQPSDAAELVNADRAGDERPIADGHETAQQHVVGKNGVVADLAIVGDVGANHQ